jgi:hypothetical protein
MSESHFKKVEIFIIVSFFVLYMLGYHYLMSSGSGKLEQRARRKTMTVAKTEREEVTVPNDTKARKVKSLQD